MTATAINTRSVLNTERNKSNTNAAKSGKIRNTKRFVAALLNTPFGHDRLGLKVAPDGTVKSVRAPNVFAERLYDAVVNEVVR